MLIRTWNVEGYEPLDDEETLAQLSYVACSMMNDGQQQLGRQRLLELLRRARAELQAELHFAAVGPSQFIDRIEQRSSLLMQIGHDWIDGELEPLYEFRHLTFQEYLAAHGLVKQQYPGRDAGRTLTDLLEPHFDDERWREVIPLAAVLAGREAESLVQRLVGACQTRAVEKTDGSPGPSPLARVLRLLEQCLLDEVQVTPATLQRALGPMARFGGEDNLVGPVGKLRRGKFGDVFQQVVEQAYFGNGPEWDESLEAMKEVVVAAFFHDRRHQLTDEVARTLGDMFDSGDRLEQARAAFVCVDLAYSSGIPADASREVMVERFRSLRDALGSLLCLDCPPLALAAAWALAWMGDGWLRGIPSDPQVIRSLFRLYREASSGHLRWHAAWAFSTQPLLSRDAFTLEDWGECDTWIRREVRQSPQQAGAALVLAWYRRRPWSDSELIKVIRSVQKHYHHYIHTLVDMLAALEAAGDRIPDQPDAPIKARNETRLAPPERLSRPGIDCVL